MKTRAQLDRSSFRFPSDDDSESDEDDFLITPYPRRAHGPPMPPLPDLRFEQSYLASIKDAPSWQMVGYVTVRDQVFMPLVQGLTWTLLVAGWRQWHGTARVGGKTIGARLRRWLWGFISNRTLAEDVKGTLRDEQVAEGIVEFYTAQSSVGSD